MNAFAQSTPVTLKPSTLDIHPKTGLTSDNRTLIQEITSKGALDELNTRDAWRELFDGYAFPLLHV